jgi:hypothetical protein
VSFLLIAMESSAKSTPAAIGIGVAGFRSRALKIEQLLLSEE